MVAKKWRAVANVTCKRRIKNIWFNNTVVRVKDKSRKLPIFLTTQSVE